MSHQCPICGSEISPFQTTREITFATQRATTHHRCWFENQDLLAQLEQKHPDVPLAELMRKWREGGPDE